MQLLSSTGSIKNEERREGYAFMTTVKYEAWLWLKWLLLQVSQVWIKCSKWWSPLKVLCSNPLNGFSSDSLNDELSQAWTLRECEYSSGMLRVQCYYLTSWVGSLPQVWEQSHELLLTGLLIEVRGETFS